MSRPATMPRRGEVWWADLDPVVGRELGRKIRPVLIVSNDDVNQGPSEKVIVVPSTTQEHQIPSRVRWAVRTPRGTITSFFSCEDVRGISVQRLRDRLGTTTVPASVMAQVEQALRVLLVL